VTGCAGDGAGANGEEFEAARSAPEIAEAPGLGNADSEKKGSGDFFALSPLVSKDFRNIAVALSGSACSGGSGPKFESSLGM
jgi:hypothetical protein